MRRSRISAISRTVAVVVIIAVVVVAGAVGALFLTAPPTTIPTTTTTHPTTTTLPPAKAFTLTARDFGFDGFGQGPTIRVKVGDSVQVTMKNGGGLEHEFRIVQTLTVTITPQSSYSVFPGSFIDLIGPVQSATITFVADRPGKYFYACFSRDGTDPKTHVDLGMWGEFIVEA